MLKKLVYSTPCCHRSTSWYLLVIRVTRLTNQNAESVYCNNKHLLTGSLAALAKLYFIAFLVCVNLSNPLGPAYDISHDSGLGHVLAPDFYSVQVHGHVLANEETNYKITKGSP